MNRNKMKNSKVDNNSNSDFVKSGRWTYEETEFLCENAAYISDEDMPDALNELFSNNRTFAGVRKMRQRLGIKKVSGRGKCIVLQSREESPLTDIQISIIKSLAIACMILFSAILMPGMSFAANVHWRHDMIGALQDAERTNTPVVVVVGSIKCPPCNQMKKTVWTDFQVAELVNSQFVPIYLDNDIPKDHLVVIKLSAEIKRVTGKRAMLPLLVVLGPNGEYITDHIGFLGRVRTLGFLRNSLTTSLDKFGGRLKKTTAPLIGTYAPNI